MELPIDPATLRPMFAATWPATRLVTVRVTSRATRWPAVSGRLRPAPVPKIEPRKSPMPPLYGGGSSVTAAAAVRCWSSSNADSRSTGVS